MKRPTKRLYWISKGDEKFLQLVTNNNTTMSRGAIRLQTQERILDRQLHDYRAVHLCHELGQFLFKTLNQVLCDNEYLRKRVHSNVFLLIHLGFHKFFTPFIETFVIPFLTVESS